MTPKENRAALVAALRSGEFRQTTGNLRSRDEQGDCYCVLGVACEISGLGQWEAAGLKMFEYVPEADPLDGRTGGLPRVVREHFGFTTDGGEFRRDGRYAALTIENDTEQRSFAELADLIESEPEGLVLTETTNAA